jgi:DNA-binding MarR family transcriptional regulator
MSPQENSTYQSFMDNSLVAPALRAIRRILRTAEEGERRLAHATGLTPSQVLVLQEVHAARDVTPSTVALALQLSQASITNISDRLEEVGLLTRRRGERDKRQVRLTLTDSGRRMLEEAPELIQNRLSTCFEQLAPWEQAMMLSALGRIADLLNPDLADPGIEHMLAPAPRTEGNGAALS